MFDPTKDDRTWEDIQESCGIEDRDTINMLASRNFDFFFEHVLGYSKGCPVTKQAIKFHQNPEKFKQTDSHMDGIKTAIMAPRGHSKTVSWTMAPALWRAFSEQGKEIIISSATKSQSKDILSDIKRIIVRNEALEHLKSSKSNVAMMGDHADIESDETNWAAESITTTTDVTMTVETFGSGIRGEHVDYVFLDDVLQDESSGNKSREQEKEDFYSVISPIIENKGGLLQIVGTPMAHDDLMMELIEKESYHSKKYKAYYPDDDRVLWPENWSMEALNQKKEEIGPARFAREYMCDPMSVEEQYFSVKDCIEPNIDEEHFKPRISDEKYAGWQFVVGVDVALSDSKGSDYNVFTVIGSPPDGEHRYVVDIIREQTMSPEDIANTLERLDNKYAFTDGYYERNAQGEGLKHEMNDRPRLRNKIDYFDTTGKSRPQILSGLQAALYRQELRIVNKENLPDELAAFHKNSRGKLEGKGHDDTVMSLAIAYSCFEDEYAGRTGMGIVGVDDDENIDIADTGIVGDYDSNDDSSDISIGIA